MVPFLTTRRAEIVALCQRYNVRRLDVFGSAARGTDFTPASDIDFLVEFEPRPPTDYADAYFELRQELIDLFGREVDLITARSIENPYFRRRIEAERQNLFEN